MAKHIEPTQEQINEIIDSLRGTTQNLEEVACAICAAEDYDQIDDRALTSQIDDALFLCSVCDWWCDRDEESDEQDGVCDDCDDSTDDDE